MWDLTAYCPCYDCSEGYGYSTCSGARATEGTTIGVDTSIIPLGSHVLINGHEYIVQDTGGGLIGKHVVDIFMEDHGSVSAFGRQRAEIYILE